MSKKESVYEIRFHGRGGQGVVLASVVLAKAFFAEGGFVQAFPSFGAERRGAPVTAFARISDKKIRERFGIYHPACLIVLEPSLVRREDTIAGLKPKGLIVLNSPDDAQGYESLASFRVATVEANAIARKYRLGSPSMPIVNTTMLGAFAAASGKVSIDSVVRAIQEELSAEAERNVDAAMDAYSSVKKGSMAGVAREVP